MAYNYNTFLKPLNTGDKNLLIFNDAGELVYTVNPFSVLNTQVRGNIITISVKSRRTILLDFLDSNYAIGALSILQERIYNLTNEIPIFIDKQLEQWIGQNTTQRIGDFASSPTLSFGNVSFNNILPTENQTWSVGSEEYKWNELHVDFAYIDNPQFDYITIPGIPFEKTNFDRWVNSQMVEPNGDPLKIGQDIVIRDGNLYFDGTSSLRFTNFTGTESHKLIRIWDWDGPIGSTHTTYPEYETTYNERAQLSYKMEDGEKSSLSLKTFDWTVGSQSGIEHEYKFYEGDIIISEGKHLYSGGLRFSSRITGTSEDLLTVLDRGFYFELTTQKYLSFQRGITVIVSNGLEDFYVDDDYYDDATAAVMFAIVDSYSESTGLLGLYVEKPIGLGRTASNWTINISGRQSTTVTLGTTASFEELTVTGTSNLQQVVGSTASFEDLTVNGPTNIQQVVEVLTTATAVMAASPSTFYMDFNDGSIFYVEPEGDNFVANYLNVPVTDNRIISTTIIISQTASAYIPDIVAINGHIVPISWSNGSLPSGNANQTDIVGFSFMRIGATWSKVFGQLSTFATI
jgi:hypothetical protein